MKKILLALFVTCITLVSCEKDVNEVSLKTVIVELVYPTEPNFSPTQGVKVKMVSPTSSFEVETDASGKATFNVPAGIYEISSSETRTQNLNQYILNGLKTGVAVTDVNTTPQIEKLTLNESKTSQIVIKELFTGGTPKDDGSGAFPYDKYIILYNNSNVDVDLKDLCIGMAAPFNAQATNSYYGEDGKLIYEADKWIPSVQAFWYFTNSSILPAGKQAVVALANAINNTLIYSKSINLDNPGYYATYDIEKFTNTTYYVSPAASIPTKNYLKAEKYSTANAWALSNTSPAVFIFKPEGMTPSQFAANSELTHTLTSAMVSKKVPVSWILDGLESYLLNNANNKKRLLSTVDAGYVFHENNQGYSIYRNVDKAATEAIAENAGKIVYNYSLGTTNLGNGGSTDPSAIDAEASIKNGAKIVYQDLNNSSNDFHLRSKASLRNN